MSPNQSRDWREEFEQCYTASKWLFSPEVKPLETKTLEQILDLLRRLLLIVPMEKETTWALEFPGAEERAELMVSALYESEQEEPETLPDLKEYRQECRSLSMAMLSRLLTIARN